ncbi:hypothetical protein [Streptomyces olivochromogenes]|uniref:hypothetical protein n=1 Tax=Streptomyces olivochromogenes TaxID=1963 RepID=UPI001F2E1889|nr:hypothetical protein [Streptomyces olivochromogenes]MCF3134740.1 hypothetical protein [Streptomyces olivochromogenes]
MATVTVRVGSTAVSPEVQQALTPQQVSDDAVTSVGGVGGPGLVVWTIAEYVPLAAEWVAVIDVGEEKTRGFEAGEVFGEESTPVMQPTTHG